jgi:hypothetical protein
VIFLSHWPFVSVLEPGTKLLRNQLTNKTKFHGQLGNVSRNRVAQCSAAQHSAAQRSTQGILEILEILEILLLT